MLKALYEKRGEIQKTMRQTLDTATKEKRDLTTEEDAKFNELSAQADEVNKQIGREVRMQEIVTEGGNQLPIDDNDGSGDTEHRTEDAAEAVEKRYHEAVAAFYRGGREGLSTEQRNAIMVADKAADVPSQVRALSANGIGVVGTRRAGTSIVDQMAIYDGAREAGATVLTTADGNAFTIPTGQDITKGDLIGEAPTPTEQAGTRAPVVGNADLSAYTFTSLEIPVSFQLLQDAAFDAEAYIMAKAAERIGRRANQEFTHGTGSNSPFGVVSRAANSTDATGTEFGYDDLLNVKNETDAAYWKDASAAYMFHQNTAIDVRKLRDADGRPIWQPAFGDKPEMIFGHKMVINNELVRYDTAAAGEALAVFGCFSKYVIRDVSAPYIIRDPYTSAKQGLVNFIVFSRHGGNTGDPQAFARLNAAA